MEEAKKSVESRSLTDCGHVRGERRWCAIIDIRRPEVHRRSAYLKTKGDNEQQNAAQGHWREDIGCSKVEIGNTECAGSAIEQRNAHQQNTCGEGAHQEVLQRSFRAFQVALICAGEDVLRDGKDFNAKEQHKQRIVAAEQVQAAKGKEDEREIISHMSAYTPDITTHQRHIKQRAARHQRIEPCAVLVYMEGFVEEQLTFADCERLVSVNASEQQALARQP